MDLETDFLAAADTLVQANYLFKAGLVDVTARLADDAVELALKTLIPLPANLRAGSGKVVAATHQYGHRRDQALARYGISSQDLRQLHNLRLVDRFREERDGHRRLLTDVQALWAIKTADQILRALLNAPEVPADVRARVLQRLDLQEEPAPEEALLDVVEHQVGWGQYDAGLRSRLIYLDRLLATRRSNVGRALHTRVLTLRAHAAMNLTVHDGPDGAIELARQAEERWERDYQDRARVVHSLQIQSICYRNKYQPRLAIPLMERALHVAGDDHELIDIIDAERASILMALGDPGRAVLLVRHAHERKRASGDALGEADCLRPLGKALMRAGKLIQADVALRRAQELTPPDYLMAQCVLAVSLTELYATCGDKVETHRWAETARQLIESRGYRHHGRLLGEMVQRFPDIW